MRTMLALLVIAAGCSDEDSFDAVDGGSIDARPNLTATWRVIDVDCDAAGGTGGTCDGSWFLFTERVTVTTTAVRYLDADDDLVAEHQAVIGAECIDVREARWDERVIFPYQVCPIDGDYDRLQAAVPIFRHNPPMGADVWTVAFARGR